MQEILLARGKGARVRVDSEAERFLEDSAEVMIDYMGRPVASLFGLWYDAGLVSFSQKPGLLQYGEGGSGDWVSMRIYSCTRLVWTHAGAMCVLHGMPLGAILGPSWVVLDGKTTRQGDPLPGIELAVLADVFDNPAQHSHEEIFKVVRRSLGLPI